MLSEQQFLTEIERTDIFRKHEKFKQSLLRKRQNTLRLYNYYQQGFRYGISYLKQNQNILLSDVNLIEEIINNTKN